MPRLDNKVAIVTGGASGLGEAIVRTLVAEGAQVVIADIQETLGQALAKQLECDFFTLDVTSEAGWEKMLHHVEEKYGRLHILVNNAGIEGPMDQSTPENTRLADWRKIQQVNVEGVFLACRAAIPLLRQSGGGSIINLSSTAALVPTPSYTAYGASKAAVRHLTKSVAMHCAQDGSGIRCNSVHPGLILTAMLLRILKQEAADSGITLEARIDEFKKRIPQGEFQEPVDVAAAVLYLASDESRHVTGTKIVVDGGGTMDG